MIPILGTAISSIIGGLFNVIDKSVEDKDQAAQIKAKLQEMAMAGQLKELESAAQIIVAEAQGESWLQRNWRHLTMLTFVALVVSTWLGFAAPGLNHDLEILLFEIIQVGLGGYVIGRSAEKIIKEYKK